MSFYEPTSNMSVMDLICYLEKPEKYNVIKNVVKQASKGFLKSILVYIEDQVIFCIFNGDFYSSNFDASACIALKTALFKLISWYDNKYGYSNRTLWPTCSLWSKEP